jgi:phosphoglycerate dehydrogenase-like enzyme
VRPLAVPSHGARRLAPFGFTLLGSDPLLDDPAILALGITPLPLDQLLSASDYVTLSVPLNAATHHLLDARRLRLMRPGACLVNTSRGGVIDEHALLEALRSERLHSVALDVVEHEPLRADHELLTFDPRRVLITPHMAASSHDVIADLHREIAESIAAILDDRWPSAVVNPTVIPRRALRR